MSATVDTSAAEYVRTIVIPAMFKLAPIPRSWDSFEARVMLMATGMQESRFKYRRQMKGPAISFWQGERTGGLVAVFNHPATGEVMRGVLERMGYGDWGPGDFEAMENNDILACAAARALLFTHPRALPDGDPDEAWHYYLSLWRPGKPHRETWDAFYLDAWAREANG